MNVNTDRYYILGHTNDGNCKQSQKSKIVFNNSPIKILTQNQSLKYLGLAIGSGCKAKADLMFEKLVNSQSLFIKILKYNLTVNQKIDATKKFVIPSLDFFLMNNEF